MVGQLPVTPGEVLYVEVAQNSFNGGGLAAEGGGAGGGASDVRTVPRRPRARLNLACWSPAAAVVAVAPSRKAAAGAAATRAVLA